MNQTMDKDITINTSYSARTNKKKQLISILENAAKSVVILLGATLLCLLFHRLGFTDSNIIMVYILGVLLTSIATFHWVYSLVSSIASVFIFNYLFIVPRFSFAAYDTGYPITFVVMFLTAFLTGILAIRYKEQAEQSSKSAQRTRILLDTDQLLAKANDKVQILTVTATQIIKLTNRNIIIFEASGGKLSTLHTFPANGKDFPSYNKEIETSAAEWVLKHNHSAGATTKLFSDSRFFYLALRVNDRIYGVIGIDIGNNLQDTSEHSILLSILSECALALENEKNIREKEAAAILAKSEQLRANLLRTISHDLRTPLTSISGNASNLISNGSHFDEETKQKLYEDIYTDSMWLINLVENLLSATRIEEGRMTLRVTTELLSDIIEEVVQYSSRKLHQHHLTVDCKDDLILVKADTKLIVQVIANLVDNAIKYTPQNSSITISARTTGSMAEISVADNGPGISEEDKDKIFDKFYCGSNKIADSRRSVGLGLFLCKAIVEAHGGTIHVEDNLPHGAIFRFTLPREEIVLHE